jgi:hypothetical protein
MSVSISIQIDDYIMSFADLIRDVGRLTQIDSAGSYSYLDIRVGDKFHNVSWEADKGFGLFLRAERRFGDKPDEFVQDPEGAAERFKAIVSAGRTPAAG